MKSQASTRYPFIIVPVSLLSVSLLMTRGAFSQDERAQTSAMGAEIASSTTQIALIEKEMERFARKLVSLEASFRQQREFAQLGIRDPEEQGMLWLRRGELGFDARFDMQGDGRTAVLKNGAFTYYQPKLKQAIVGRIDTGATGSGSGFETGFLGFLLSDWDDLRADYAFELLPQTEASSIDEKHLRLTAKRDSSSFYRRVDLWISTKHWLPIRQRLFEPNGNVHHVSIDVRKLNPTIADEVFELDLPRDVKRIRS